jgi:hypothetical protein
MTYLYIYGTTFLPSLAVIPMAGIAMKVNYHHQRWWL